MPGTDHTQSDTWNQEEFERANPRVREARLKYERICVEWNCEPYDGFDKDKHVNEFRAYLDGLLALPSETVRILQEMESEKRGER